MSYETFSELSDFDEKTDMVILNDLQDLSKNIEAKTHIINPFNIMLLKIQETSLNGNKFRKTKKFINNIIEYLLKYMVSYNRLSRKEITETLKRLIEEKKSQNMLLDKV